MTPAIDELTGAGVAHTVHEYRHGDGRHGEGYGLEAARELGLAPEVVFKTLVVTGVPGPGAVAVIPVDAHLDLKAAAAVFGVKRITMCPPDQAQRITGYVVGGISPLGQRRRLPTVVDASALDHDRIYVSGGRRGLDVGLAPADLVRLCAAGVHRVSSR